MKTILQTLTEVNKRKLCNNCRNQRNNWKEKDQKKHGCYSNMIPGFYATSPRNIKNNKKVDVMIIADSHGGGGGTDAFRKQKNVYLEVSSISSYYLENKLDSFHQEQMRYLLMHLNSTNTKWYFTDLIKCFVKHDKTNTSLAINHCKNYLNYQLKSLKVKTILCLGKRVFNETLGVLGARAKFEHGKQYIINDYKIIASYFPAGFTSNLWVEKQKWKKVLPLLK